MFVQAYQRHLGSYPVEAIQFLSDKAIARCRWFPTVAECLDILAEWRRDDEHTQRKALARRIVANEREHRREQERHERNLRERPWNFEMTQEYVDSLSPELIRIGLSCKALRENDEGKVVPWFGKEGEEPFF